MPAIPGRITSLSLFVGANHLYAYGSSCYVCLLHVRHLMMLLRWFFLTVSPLLNSNLVPALPSRLSYSFQQVERDNWNLLFLELVSIQIQGHIHWVCYPSIDSCMFVAIIDDVLQQFMICKQLEFLALEVISKLLQREENRQTFSIVGPIILLCFGQTPTCIMKSVQENRHFSNGVYFCWIWIFSETFLKEIGKRRNKFLVHAMFKSCPLFTYNEP